MNKKNVSTIFVVLMLASIFALCINVNASDLKINLELKCNGNPSHDKTEYLLTHVTVYLRGYSKGRHEQTVDYNAEFHGIEPGLYIVKSTAGAGCYTLPKLVYLGEGQSKTINYKIREIGSFMAPIRNLIGLINGPF